MAESFVSDKSVNTGELVSLIDFRNAVSRAAQMSRANGTCSVAMVFSAVEIERLALLLMAVH